MGGEEVQGSATHPQVSALQIEAMKAQQATKESDLTQDPTSQRSKRKPPRKRYFNGYGKVPGIIEPLEKDKDAKISRAFSGRSWNRGSSIKGTTSLSSRTNLRKDASAYTQFQPMRTQQNKLAFNFGGSNDDKSQFD